jgi:hypothetical protein
VRAIGRATAVKTPPDSEVGFAGTAGAIGDLAGFLRILRLGTPKSLKNSIYVFSGPLEDPDGPFERSLAAFDDLGYEELK